MKLSCCVIITFTCMLAMRAQAARPAFTLAREGRPACAIVIAEKAGENASIGAGELQLYIEKISGARLPIVTDADPLPAGGKVLVGRSRLTDKLGVKIPDGVTPDLREEGFINRTVGDSLVLAGNDTYPYYGTRYAVYALLKRLGVRWFLPGEYGEVTPRIATVTVPALAVEEHPSFRVRSFWTHSQGTMFEERELWKIRNFMSSRSAGWFGVPGDGSLNEYLPKDMIKDHPEWFALQPDGSRSPDMPCMSDELRRNDPKYAGQPRLLDEIMKVIDQQVKNGMRNSPMSPNDGTPACDCDLCKNLSIRYSQGMIPDRANSGYLPDYLNGNEWFFFVNNILEETAKRYPGHLIAANGYANRVFPPEPLPGFNRHNNLVIMFADIMGCTIHRYNDPKCWQCQQQYNMIRQWCKLSDKVWVYGYNYTMCVGKGTLLPMTRRVAANIPLLKKAGVIGFNDQEESNMEALGIPTYVVRTTLEWNADADTRAVLNDFYRKWFGAAAVPMQDYYNTLENSFDSTNVHGHEDPMLQLIYTPKVMARLRQDITLAEKAAKTDAEKLHVRAERLVFDHLQYYADSLIAKREYRFADAAAIMQKMLALRDETNKITPFYGWHPYAVYAEDWEVNRMKMVSSKVDGAAGSLFSPLTDSPRFSADKFDMGRSERWMEPDYDDSKWQLGNTSLGWQNQPGLLDNAGQPMMTRDGHNYAGFAWYRFTVELPAAGDKEIHLYCPAMTNQAWTWVNGQYAGRSVYQSCYFRPSEYDVDITPYLKPGKNVIALRVLCTETYFGGNGLYERPFLYVKKQ